MWCGHSLISLYLIIVVLILQIFVFNLPVFLSLSVLQMTLEDYDRASMFPCPCVRELFIMLVQFLRERQFKSAKQASRLGLGFANEP